MRGKLGGEVHEIEVVAGGFDELGDGVCGWEGGWG